MKGQLTYNKKDKTWEHTPLNKLTHEICGAPYKIQSREGNKDLYKDDSYYIASTGGNRNYDFGDVGLQYLKEWVESIVENIK